MSDRPVTKRSRAPDWLSKRRSSAGATASAQDKDLVQDFIWDIVSINVYFEDIRYMLAQLMGITGPQWLILMAINYLDRGKGVAVKVVAEKLHVDPSFVTTQTKSLERNALIRRITSAVDARVVLMSLTDKASKQIANLSLRQEKINDFIFIDLDCVDLEYITSKLTMLKNRLEKAALRFEAEI